MQEVNQTLPQAVQDIHHLRLVGNITPHEWYKKITFDNGKPDLVAVTLLSEIIYQYRPYQIFDPSTNEPTGWAKKFRNDRWQCSSGFFVRKFGLGKKQALGAISRLEKHGLIIKEVRDKEIINGRLYSNVMYLEPIVKAIKKLTFMDKPVDLTEDIYAMSSPKPTLYSMGDTPSPSQDTPSPPCATPSPSEDTYTINNTINNTTKTTTTAITEKIDAPTPKETGGGGGGDNLIFPKCLEHPTRKKGAINKLKGFDFELKQTMLDTIAFQAKHSGFTKSPLLFLSGLIKRYNLGTFDDSGAIETQRMRENHKQALEREKQMEANRNHSLIVKSPLKRKPATEKDIKTLDSRMKGLREALGQRF